MAKQTVGKSRDYLLIEKIQNPRTRKETRKKAIGELHQLYERVFIKQRINLEQKCRELNLGVDTSDYFGATYDAFLNSIATVRLYDLKKPETYGHWICLNGYLRSKNRDIIHGLLKDRHSTIMLDDGSKYESEERIPKGVLKSNSVENQFFRNEQTKPFWNAVDESLKHLNAKQMQFWNLLTSGEKKNNIKDMLKMDNKQFKENLIYIQDLFKRNLKQSTGSMDYSELVELLA